MTQSIDKNSPWARHIAAAAQRGALSHAVILSGSGEKENCGRYVAAAMMCQNEKRPCLTCRDCRKVMEGIHPDLIIVREEDRKELAAETVRQIRQDAYIRPNEAGRKVYMFPTAGQLNEKDQNILLKIVEEGPAYAAFIFCTESSQMLLPTIRSRCTEYVSPAQGEEWSEGTQEWIRQLCEGGGTAIPAYLVELENRKIGREPLKKMLQQTWAAFAEAQLQSRGKSPDGTAASRAAEELCRRFSRRQLEKMTELLAQYSAECNYNVGEGHILGALAVEMEDIIQ